MIYKLRFVIIRLTLALSLLGPGFSFAQNEVDALRYSTRNIQGSARFNAMGGAFGALGADMSVTLTNPAGLARFNKSEVVFSPGLYLPSTKTEYNGTTGLGTDRQLRMANIGLVGANRLENNAITPWRSVQFAITYNRLNMFDNDILIQGENTNSLLAVFANQAYGVIPENLEQEFPFTSNLAYQTYTIDPYVDSNGVTAYKHRLPAGNIEQTKTIERHGGMNETSLAFSGNYQDKFYIGASIAFPRVRFEEVTRHSEMPVTDTSANGLASFTFREELNTSGFGINGKIGVIYLPLDWVRIGAAIHTPTAFSMSDSWASRMNSSLTNGESYSWQSPAGSFNYVLRTPARFIGRAAVIILKKGLVSLDYEVTNMSGSKLRSGRYGNYSFNAENDAIDRLYKATNEIRLGAEWRVITPLSVRAGFNYRTSPYIVGVTENDAEMMAISFGAGYRKAKWYVDLSYTHRQWSEDFYLYDPALVNEATIQNTPGFLSITAGIRY